MSWEIHRLQGSLGEHRAAWDALNAELHGGNPYFASRFIDPLLKHFSSGNELLCVNERSGRIGSMLIVKPNRSGKWSLFVPAQAQVAPIFSVQPNDLASLLSRLSWRALALECPCQDPEHSPLDQLTAQPTQVVPHAHTICVRLDTSFDDYWRARSANLRKATARRERRVQDAGFQMRLEHLTDPASMHGAVERFGSLESSGWKGASGTAVHINNLQGKFYCDVLSAFASGGQASVYELYFNETLVAMQIALASKDMLVLLKTAYDESQSKLSPGRLLLRRVLEEEFRLRRAKSVEFYTDANADQVTWATHERWINNCLIFRNKLVHAAFKLKARASSTSGLARRTAPPMLERSDDQP